MEKISAFWFRRDLRLDDNTGLIAALKSGKPVLPLFIFDRYILDKLEDKDDARVGFIHSRLEKLNEELQIWGSSLLVAYGKPLDVWKCWLSQFPIAAVYCNRDTEPYALERDKRIATLLQERGVEFQTFKDQVIFEGNEVLKPDGQAYSVFTPYSRRWLSRYEESAPRVQKLPANPVFFTGSKRPLPSLASMKFKASSIAIPEAAISEKTLKSYASLRDFPAEPGVSRLGIHLRFGSISIRRLVQKAIPTSKVFVNELIWREFYQMILFQHPRVVGQAFKPAYDRIPWRDDPEGFERWQKGLTGYPLVDAGMRELAQTGYMHNRVRMVTASFLTKHLLIDWRWGEAWFARKLLDFELASNNGGWQWAAGCGCDAAPYFRVFNPLNQAQKFDPKGAYIRRWVPEYGTQRYVEPMIEHRFARERVLGVFKKALAEH